MNLRDEVNLEGFESNLLMENCALFQFKKLKLPPFYFKMPLDEQLLAYTQALAGEHRRERTVGRLQVGQYADLNLQDLLPGFGAVFYSDDKDGMYQIQTWASGTYVKKERENPSGQLWNLIKQHQHYTYTERTVSNTGTTSASAMYIWYGIYMKSLVAGTLILVNYDHSYIIIIKQGSGLEKGAYTRKRVLPDSCTPRSMVLPCNLPLTQL